MNILDLFIKLLSDLYHVNVLLFILVLSTVGIILLFSFRVLLHFLIRLIGRRDASSQPIKFRVDENFDFVNGWRKEDKEGRTK